MKTTSNIEILGEKKITKSFLKKLKDNGEVLVEAVSQQMLRCGTVVVAGDNFVTDIAYAELLKKTYKFLLH